VVSRSGLLAPVAIGDNKRARARPLEKTLARDEDDAASRIDVGEGEDIISS
jgi:hypothetical protein